MPPKLWPTLKSQSLLKSRSRSTFSHAIVFDCQQHSYLIITIYDENYFEFVHPHSPIRLLTVHGNILHCIEVMSARAYARGKEIHENNFKNKYLLRLYRKSKQDMTERFWFYALV